MIDLTTKEQIKDELRNYVEHVGSANKAATQLDVSNAYISQILNDKSEKISDDMWRKIAKCLNMSLEDKWRHADTKPSLKIGKYFDDARIHGNVFGLVAEPGTGKTDMLDHYMMKEKNVFYVKCDRFMSEVTVLKHLLITMGKNVHTGGASALIAQVKNVTDRTDRPVIILDEMEKVKPDVMLLFIDLYNALWKRCGIVIIGTPNLRARIEKGVEKGKIGFNEILSRLGGKLIDIPKADEEDAKLVININGIADTMTTQSIINNSYVGRETDVRGRVTTEGYIDMRRVERLVHAQKQKIKQAA